MDNQTAFNRVCEHLLLKQKRPSISVSGRCCYRGAGGRSCAVGCLLSDDVAKKLDGLQPVVDTTWRTICALSEEATHPEAAACKAAVAELDGVSPALLQALQQAHDQYSTEMSEEKWLHHLRYELGVIANAYDLHKPDFL